MKKSFPWAALFEKWPRPTNCNFGVGYTINTLY